MTRGQSNVVAVALLLSIAVVSMGALTASIGSVVESNAARADAVRVAADLDAALEPVGTTGADRARVSFTSGRLHPVEREIRILDAGGVVRLIDADALVFEGNKRRVTFLAGAITVGSNRATFRRTPPVTASRAARVLVIGVATLGDPGSVAGRGGVRTTVRTRVTHDRTTLGNGTWRIAVETATPTPWRDFFARQGATVRERNFDDDGTTSVVARYPEQRRAYLVIHSLHAEVGG